MGVRISAVIITFNEERNIGRCLESLQGIADEIVVVDSYSTDRTEEICRSYHARFIRHRFKGHIEQKNWAILQATSPYILSLDADEALTAELKASIQKVKEQWKHDGYYFNRLTSYCGKWIRHTSWYPSRKLRLWDARKGSWGGLNPHDKFFLLRGSTRKFLKGKLLHYSYYSVEEHLQKMNNFSSIIARSYYEQGRRAYFFSSVVHPMWRFTKDFLLGLGFLDGYYGYIISVNSAHEVFLKYIKLRNIYLKVRKEEKQSICFINSMKSWGGGEKWHFDVTHLLSRLNYRTLYLSSPGSPLSEKLKKEGIPGHDMRISNLSVLNPFKLFRIVRIFRKEKVGVVLTILSRDMKIASIAAKIAGVPSIIYRRGSANPVRDSFINRYLLRRVVTRIVANSMETRRTILQNNEKLVPEDKIRVIYNGVYLPLFHSNVVPLFPPEDGVIFLGAAGRLSEEKGHIRLLEMMSLLKGKGYRFKLLVAGEGKLLPELKREAVKLGVEDEVKFLGFVKEMPAFYQSLDIFLLTSQYEGFGYVLAEAMASRKPVIAFDIKSSAEIIEQGKTGFITERNNVKELSDRVLELAGDSALRERMGIKGRERVEQLFSFEKNQQEVLKLLDLS